ncbi:MAG: hypothetical protein PHH26_07815 [Candidatus Thermoplasmatota archaeon]|nr:hypothetical protein [Candidatus Thermoplasmatota archaeon]
MADLLKDGMEFLDVQRKMYMTEDVIYKRGESSVNLRATVGKTDFEVGEEGCFKVGSHVVDFLLTATDLVLNGSPVLPEMGDEIEYNGKTFTVLHLPSDGFWRWSDPYGKTMRIHTKIAN